MNMKSILPLTVLLLALVAQAQDPAVVAPDFYKCTFENEHARLCEVSFKPGATIPSHSHPQHLVYAVTSGKIRIFKANAEPTDVELVPGQVLWIPAETHHGTNTGDAELKLLVVEFRDLKDAAMDKAEDKAKADTESKPSGQ
ncbi:cupin domain-containing protein [Lysobacter sp. CFH 32150]|uniref:cupin domain-containing protein n=1 Tax=Lysobacter sp. CFH 32150 TaxID=2927128 RepID=UPI001FA7D035|nr:cupin domain-containing protein [Lysobacter sp. CFH 32150]MCI4567277.1 cupin domain-containing protein [Lysobacter sp. CFH 32150]